MKRDKLGKGFVIEESDAPEHIQDIDMEALCANILLGCFSSWENPEDQVPIHVHMKHISTYRELLHVLRITSLVAFAPDPSLLMACLAA